MKIKKQEESPDSEQGNGRQAWFDSLERLLSAIDNCNVDPEPHSSGAQQGHAAGKPRSVRAERSGFPPDVEQPAES